MSLLLVGGIILACFVAAWWWWAGQIYPLDFHEGVGEDAIGGDEE